MRQTPLSQLVEIKLGQPLREYVVAARTVSGPTDKQTGWRQIAADLTARTGVKVSWEALRSWFDDERADDATAERVPA